MTENVDNVQELAGFAVDKLDTYFKLAEETINKYGGDAVDLGLNVLRIEAISSLIPGIIGIIIFIIAFKICSYSSIQFKKISNYSEYEGEERKKLQSYYRRDYEVFAMIISILSGIATIVGLGYAFTIFSVWSWVGIFYPELYAVHKLILT